MKKLKAWMTEHKKFSVIALCLLLMFTCGSAMSAINVSHHRAETAKEQNAGNNTDTTTAAEKKTKEETGKVELTDAQKEIIKGYDTDAKELIDTLSSSVWSVSEGRYTLKFADDSYVETVNGTPTVHSYAISRVEKTSDGWLLQIAATLFNTYFGVINQTLDAKFISGPFNELFGTTEPYGVVKDFYQAGVIPVAHAILGLFMLMQLIKISQRIDATSTLPAVKDIVFLVVTYCILSYFIDNALDLVSAIYSIFNDLVGNVSDKLQSKNWYEPGIKMTKDDAADATFGGCFLLLIFGLISWAVGLVFYAVSMVVALGRSVQLYVYAAFSPIPISLLGFEETKQIGIGYLKNFAAAALAGVVMVLILYLYPHLVTALAVSGGLGKAEMLGLAQGVETFDSFGVIIKTIAVLITTMMGLVKSGSWAKEILGA